MKAIRLIFAVTALAASAIRAQDATYANAEYTITLPGGWERTILSDSGSIFEDTTGVFAGILSIERHGFDTTQFPDPEAWTRNAYAEYLAGMSDPLLYRGEIVYRDSSSAARLGELWSPEVFSIIPSFDTLPTAGEYLRFCAVKGAGYRFQAMGDSLDMADNVDFYAEFLATARLTAPGASSIRPVMRRIPRVPKYRRWEYDLMGRKLRGGAERSIQAFP